MGGFAFPSNLQVGPSQLQASPKPDGRRAGKWRNGRPAPGLHILISGAGAQVLTGPTLGAPRGRSLLAPPPWALAGRSGLLPPPFLSRSGQGRSGEAAGAALSLAEEEGGRGRSAVEQGGAWQAAD